MHSLIFAESYEEEKRIIPGSMDRFWTPGCPLSCGWIEKCACHLNCPLVRKNMNKWSNWSRLLMSNTLVLFYLSISFFFFFVITWKDALTKKRAKKALMESNFENRLSFMGESRFFLHNQVFLLSYKACNGWHPRRAILALFLFLSVIIVFSWIRHKADFAIMIMLVSMNDPSCEAVL